jgi:hypothetical protein
MKLRWYLSLAAISCVLLALPARTARRPRYGGTLRVEIPVAIASLDPTTSFSPELASARDQLLALIYARNISDKAFSTAQGPFRVLEFEAGKRIKLAANDNYPTGRPFVDTVEVQMGRSAKDRLLDLELGKADIAGIPAEQARHAADSGVRLSVSKLNELVALAFVSGRQLAENARLRQALSHSIDRKAIANFILQKEGEAAGGLLPQWSSGTAFLFSTDADITAAKEQGLQIAGSPKISVGYDAGDALEQAMVERIVVDAREAGITVLPTAVTPSSASIPKMDGRLLRLRMASPHPREALAGFLMTLGPLSGVDVSLPPGPPETLYECERTIVSSYRVIPLVWLPQVYGVSRRVRNWKTPGPGETWPLADVWLDDLGIASTAK